MRKTALSILAAAAVGLAGAALFAFVLREEPLARGELVEALLQEADEDRLTEVFARFVPGGAPFDQRIPPLLANGFRCDIRLANVEGSSYLTCERPTEGTGYCKGFRYYSYRTRAGEIIDTLGSAFDIQRGKTILGRCEDSRQYFLELKADAGEIQQAAQR